MITLLSKPAGEADSQPTYRYKSDERSKLTQSCSEGEGRTQNHKPCFYLSTKLLAGVETQYVG